jgi:hemerythrin
LKGGKNHDLKQCGDQLATFPEETELLAQYDYKLFERHQELHRLGGRHFGKRHSYNGLALH